MTVMQYFLIILALLNYQPFNNNEKQQKNGRHVPLVLGASNEVLRIINFQSDDYDNASDFMV
jgi:hypothetical protein